MHSSHTFSIREAFVFGWDTVRTHSALVFQVVITLFAIQVAQAIVSEVLKETLIGLLASIVLTLVGLAAGVGAAVITLKLAKKEHAHYRDLLQPVNFIVRFVLAGLYAALITALPVLAAMAVFLPLGFFIAGPELSFSEGATVELAGRVLTAALVVGLGMFVGIIGALYFALRYSMVRFAVVDGAAIRESLKKSAHLTDGVKWKLVLFVLAAILVNILGLLALLVGVLVSLPVTMLAHGHIYLKLKERGR